MIRNCNTGSLVVLAALQSMDEEFFLTGSRFFGDVRVWSDWDFFTQDSEEVQDKLLQLGFEPVFHDNYEGDISFIVVMEHKDHPIHVQLVKDVKVKNIAQTILVHFEKPNKLTLTDKEIRALWNRALVVAESIVRHAEDESSLMTIPLRLV